METSANVHTEPEAPRRQGRTCRDRQRTPPKKRHDPKRATPECPASHERASGLYAQCARPRASHELNNGRAEPALRLNALDPRIPRISHKRGLECTGGSSSQIWMCARHGQGALVCDGFSSRDVQRARDYQLPTGVINMRGRRHFRRYLQFCSALSISANFSSAPLVL